MQTSQDQILKIVFVGPPNGGKTSLLNRITEDKFYNRYMATIGADFKSKNIEIDGVKVKVQMWDTAGQERFLTLVSPAYYRGASGIFITFDLADEKSFQQLQQILESRLYEKQVGIKELVSADVPKVLVGCKSDLQEREIAEDIAQAFANDLGIFYIETSSKTGYNCLTAFNILAKLSYSYVLSQDVNQQAQQQQQKQLQIKEKKKIGCC